MGSLTQGQSTDQRNDVPGGVDVTNELLGHIPVIEHFVIVLNIFLNILARALGHTAMEDRSTAEK